MKNEYTKLHERHTEVSLDWTVRCVNHSVIDEHTPWLHNAFWVDYAVCNINVLLSSSCWIISGNVTTGIILIERVWGWRSCCFWQCLSFFLNDVSVLALIMFSCSRFHSKLLFLFLQRVTFLPFEAKTLHCFIFAIVLSELHLLQSITIIFGTHILQ